MRSLQSGGKTKLSKRRPPIIVHNNRENQDANITRYKSLNTFVENDLDIKVK